MKKRQQERSIANRLLKLNLSLMSILLVISCLIVFVVVKNTAENTVGREAIRTVKNAAKFIDKEEYKKFLQNPQSGDVQYERLRKQLDTIRKHSGAMSLYTLSVDNGKTYLLIDGLPIEDATEVHTSMPLITESILEPVLKGGATFTPIEEDPPNGKSLTAYSSIKDEDGKVLGVLGIDISANEIGAIQSELLKQFLPLSLFAFIIIIAIASYLIYRSTSRNLRPLQTMNQALEQLAEGEMHASLETMEGLEVREHNEIAVFSTNFTRAVGKLNSLLGNVQDTAHVFIDSAEKVKANVASVKQSSDAIAGSISGIKSGSTSQRTMNTEISNAMADMASGIMEIADTSAEIRNMSEGSSALALESDQNARRVISQMEDLQAFSGRANHAVAEFNSQFRQVEEIIGVISDISERTNLLALNASIEAARAGEAGKGFSVVADEIRKLADQSSKSADDIRKLISKFGVMADELLSDTASSADKTENVMESVESIGKMLNEIHHSIDGVHQQIKSAAAVSEAMAAGSEEILASVEQIEELSGKNAAEAEVVAKETDDQQIVMEKLLDSARLQSELALKLEESVSQFNKQK